MGASCANPEGGPWQSALHAACALDPVDRFDDRAAARRADGDHADGLRVRSARIVVLSGEPAALDRILRPRALLLLSAHARHAARSAGYQFQQGPARRWLRPDAYG